MRHFTYKSLDDLRHGATELGATHVQFEDDPARVPAALARPVPVSRFQVGNSIAIHPMEDCDGTPAGRPDELTARPNERLSPGAPKPVCSEPTPARQAPR